MLTWYHFSPHLCHLWHLNKKETLPWSEIRGAHSCRSKCSQGTAPNVPQSPAQKSHKGSSSPQREDWGAQEGRISASRLSHQLFSRSPPVCHPALKISDLPDPTIPWANSWKLPPSYSFFLSLSLSLLVLFLENLIQIYLILTPYIYLYDVGQF